MRELEILNILKDWDVLGVEMMSFLDPSVDHLATVLIFFNLTIKVSAYSG